MPRPVQLLEAYFADLIGPIFLGTAVASFLGGCVLVTSIDYFKFYRQDHIVLKLLVGTFVVLNAIGVASAIAYMYEILISGFGDYARSAREPAVFWVNPLCSVATGLMAETYFAHRAWIISKKLPVLIFLVILIITSFVCQSVAMALGMNPGTTHSIETLLAWVQASCWTPFAANLSISLIFVWYMNKNRGGSASTDEAVNSLLKISLITAAFPSLVALGSALCSRFQGFTSAYQFLFTYALPPVYALAVVYTLNSRRRLRDMIQAGDSTGIHVSRKGFGTGQTSAVHGINIQLESVTHHDDVDGSYRQQSYLEAGTPYTFYGERKALPKSNVF